MELGAFSVSLAVQDLALSHAFYTKLGFAQVGGEDDQGWLILRNGDTTVGLFQGMFDNNIMTFNPGWNSDASTKNSFTDVRELQQALLEDGVELMSTVDESTSGPGSFMLTDPDGNQILIDQHV